MKGTQNIDDSIYLSHFLRTVSLLISFTQEKSNLSVGLRHNYFTSFLSTVRCSLLTPTSLPYYRLCWDGK